MTRSISFYTGMILFLLITSSFGQEKTDAEQTKLSEMSLTELLNIDINVASKKALSLRESPGIVSVITDDEIQKSGARDMIDILRLVPGFEFGVDVEGVTGLGIRGSWAHEGKVLLLVDGIEFNERLFSTTQFGNHFPVDQIKKIEIIRGPGSAIYGGYAELGVINIITKTAADIKGINLTGQFGQMKHGFGRYGVNLSSGYLLNDFSAAIQVNINKAQRSDMEFVDFSGNAYSMQNNSDLFSLFINSSFSYKDISLKVVFDDYQNTNKDAFFVNLPEKLPAVPTYFRTFASEIKYDYKMENYIGKLTISPKITYKHQSPWVIKESYRVENFQPDSLFSPYYFYYDVSNETITGSLIFEYEPTEDLNFVFGLETLSDKGIANDQYSKFIKTASESVSYSNFSAFAQALWINPYVNITLGGRFDKHSNFGSSFVPRVALTKVYDKLHFKLLYANAFRAPGIKNIDGAPGNVILKPEKTTVYEFEIGYQTSDNMFLTANLFHISIKDPIIYFVDDAGEGYNNFEKTGTRGIEIEAKVKAKHQFYTLSYSYYEAIENTVTDYIVPGQELNFVGFARHKISFFGSLEIAENLSFNPSIVFLSNRFGYSATGQKEFPAITLVNLSFHYKNIFNKDINLSFTAFDLLETNYAFIQPYNGGHAELPGPSREFMLKISYGLNF